MSRYPRGDPAVLLYRPVTDDYRSSKVTVASAVHKTIRDGDYNWLPELVTDVDLLWESNCASGWTAVHFAASHFLPTEWFEWVLVRAAQSDPAAFFHKKNALGQTVFDVFFRSYFEPLPWQSADVRARSSFLRQSIDTVCIHYDLLQMLRERLQAYYDSRGRRGPHTRMDKIQIMWTLRQSSLSLSSSSSSSSSRISTGSLAVHRVLRFLMDLDLLCRAAAFGTLDYATHIISVSHDEGSSDEGSDAVHTTTTPPWNWLGFLAQTGSCPRAVCHLVLALNAHQAQMPCHTTITTSTLHRHYYYVNSLPLHMWCRASTECPEQDGMLLVLLEAYPEAATAPDGQGRLPLELAIQQGKTWDRMEPLFHVAPTILQQRPGLFVLAALAPTSSPDAAVIRARQNTAGQKGLVSLWNLNSHAKQQEAIIQAQAELDRERLTTIFCILMAYPDALEEARAGLGGRKGPPNRAA